MTIVGFKYGYSIFAEKYTNYADDTLDIKFRIYAENMQFKEPYQDKVLIKVQYPMWNLITLQKDACKIFMLERTVDAFREADVFANESEIQKAVWSLGLGKPPTFATGGIISAGSYQLNSGGWLTYHHPTGGSSMKTSWDLQKYYANISGSESVSAKATRLPGMEYVTKCPKCDTRGGLYFLVQHFNDGHPCRLVDPITGGHPKTPHPCTRDEIADWLDDLHDSGKVDLSFKVEGTEGKVDSDEQD